jgi:hypothetical protein
MLSFYYKKQEEQKALKKAAEEDHDADSYLGSTWANPKGLKNALTGVSSVSWRPR